MGDLTWLASATAFAVAMLATPGPNNAMVAASGASWGLKRTVPHMLGVCAGLPVLLVAVALGAGEVLRERPWLHEALRWTGAGYLLWLAWRTATARPAPALGLVGSRAAGPGRGPLGFAQAALFQWVNPKAWMTAIGAVATFTTARDGALLGQVAPLAVVILAVSLPTVVLWALVGVGAARVLRTPQALRGFNLAMAALLVASLLPLLAG